MTKRAYIFKTLKWSLYFVCFLIVLFFLANVIFKYFGAVELQVVNKISAVSTVIRLVAICLVYVFWEKIIFYVAGKNEMRRDDERVVFALDSRLYAFLALLFIELVVMQNVLGKIL